MCIELQYCKHQSYTLRTPVQLALIKEVTSEEISEIYLFGIYAGAERVEGGPRSREQLLLNVMDIFMQKILKYLLNRVA